MVIWGAMAFPVITIIILAFFYGRKIVWWEYLLLLVVPALLILGIKAGVEASQVACTEYWGGYLTKAVYYEDWDEWHTETCTRLVACGTDSEGNTEYCMEFYDCSHRDYYPEEWEASNNIGETYTISRAYFEYLCKLWGNRNFVDMNRHFYTKDGDSYNTGYDNKRENLIPTTSEHHYENRVQASHSVFNFREFKKGEAQALKLYEHPPILGTFNQECVLGWDDSLDQGKGEKAFSAVNAIYGRPSKLRVYVLVWRDHQPLQVSFDQEAYWKGGNKNELVICIGTSPGTGDKPDWARVFGWTKNEQIKIEIRDRIMSYDRTPGNLTGPVLDLADLAFFVEQKVAGKVIRRDFREFSYLTVEPPTSAVIWTCIFSALLSVGLAVFAVKNEIDLE